MAIVFSNLGVSLDDVSDGGAVNPDINDTSDANSFSNSSWTPPTDGIILVWAMARNITGGPITPTMSGNSLTWTQIGTTFDCADQTGGNGISLFIADTTGATTGATTIDYSGTTQAHCTLHFIQVEGVDISGGVAAAVVQTVTETDWDTTSLSTTLAAAGDAANRPIGMFWHFDDEPITERANWTKYDASRGLAIRRGIGSCYRDDAFETTASMSWSTTEDSAIFVIELKAELATGGLVGRRAANRGIVRGVARGV